MKEALRLALRALQDYERNTKGVMIPQTQVRGDEAITAIKEALALTSTQCEEQPAPVPLTLGQKQRLRSSVGNKPPLKDRVNAYGLAIEAAHGIKENT
jgi:predicted RNase H-like HicB family nuclease